MSGPLPVDVHRVNSAPSTVGAVLAWLQRAFGFTELALHRDDGDAIVHAELSLGPGIIMLGQCNEIGWLEVSSPDPLASTVSIYVAIDDPDAHHDRAVAAGARIVRPLTDEDYGSREHSARDLEGNLWSFGTYKPVAAG